MNAHSLSVKSIIAANRLMESARMEEYRQASPEERARFVILLSDWSRISRRIDHVLELALEAADAAKEEAA
jgi:hypothetical protein